MNTKNISLNKEVIESPGFKSAFCKHWGTAKIALNLLHDAVKNPIVKSIITIVIKAGDALHAKTCS